MTRGRARGVAFFKTAETRALDSSEHQRKSKPHYQPRVHPVDEQDTMTGMHMDRREFLRSAALAPAAFGISRGAAARTTV